MAGSLSTYAANKISDLILSGTSISALLPPASPSGDSQRLQIELFMTVPAADETGGAVCDATGYSRVKVAANTSDYWETAASGVKATKTAHTFAAFSTAPSDTIKGFGLYNPVDSHYWWMESFSPITIPAGRAYKFQAGQISISLGAPIAQPAANKILDHIFGLAALSVPATWKMRLWNTLLAIDGTGGTECTGTGYAAVTQTNDAANWPAASGGAKSNATAFTFSASAGADWGTINGYSLDDNAGTPEYWLIDSFTESLVVAELDPVSVPAGNIDWTLS